MTTSKTLGHLTILIRGAGEMASGIAWRLYRSGFRRLLMTEIAQPLAVRRSVSFSEAVWDLSHAVEGVTARRIAALGEAESAWQDSTIAVLVDADCRVAPILKPDVLVDAILAKRNLGTHIHNAPLVIGLGPGFRAGSDVHCVVETNRGHHLGRLLTDGSAAPDTGIPGEIGGHTVRRVLRAPTGGVFEARLAIGEAVNEGDLVGNVAGQGVHAGLAGMLRGLIRSGTLVRQGLKIGDIDPRGDPSYCLTISEKARAIAGAVLEAILMKYNLP
ncbi:MAG: selenium-dependent molybdenum cofactor biosynthesis protein YqeB [Thermodesulfobacteriota bacterium]